MHTTGTAVGSFLPTNEAGACFARRAGADSQVLSNWTGWISMAKRYLGNLSEGCQKEDVQDAFARFGAIEAIWIARKPPGVTLALGVPLQEDRV